MKLQRPPRDERPPLRCYQNAAIVCDPKQLRLAPRNICARTETPCRRLRRKLKLAKRKGRKDLVFTPPEEPKETGLLWSRRY